MLAMHNVNPDSAIKDRLSHALRARVPDEAVEQTVQRLLDLSREMAVYGAQRTDPIRDVFARLGDRWSLLILLVLQADTFRHSELRSIVGLLSDEGGISQRMLTLRLRDLERGGFIDRTVSDDIPPRVDYLMTDLGRSLLGQVEQLMSWVKAHSDTIRKRQAEFDQLHD